MTITKPLPHGYQVVYSYNEPHCLRALVLRPDASVLGNCWVIVIRDFARRGYHGNESLMLEIARVLAPSADNVRTVYDAEQYVPIESQLTWDDYKALRDAAIGSVSR